MSERNRGRLRNGNPAGDPTSSPRCGAKTRSGEPCRGPAMWNPRTERYVRCRMHGAFGPRGAEALLRSKKANWKHGKFSAAAKAKAKQRAQLMRWARAEVKAVERELAEGKAVCDQEKVST
jgi:hypothetical protein